MKYGCIGEHLKHSFSKEIHNFLGDYQYEICEIAPECLDKFMRDAEFSAINVTIPYKEKVIPYLDAISPTAAEIGAVNTIVNRNGKLYGYNTDFYGMRSLILRMKLDLSGKKVAILGTGGTSKTACAVAKSLNAEAIFRVSRKKSDNFLTYDELYALHSDSEIIINTTPVGMYPNSQASPVDLDRLPKVEGVVDAVYNPLNTQLIQSAGKKGLKAQCGLYMLVAQAVRASEFFMDTQYPEDTSEKIYHRILKQKQNIVLTGMPGSGKSSVGKLLTEKLGRKFYDTDTLIEEELNCKISDIFAKEGEKYFRDAESEAIKKVSQENCLIIATGGGSVLRAENIDALGSNGLIFFIDRSPEYLLPTDNRPLSSNREDLLKRYNERYETYCSTADVKISGDGLSPEEITDLILKEFDCYEDLCD